MITNCRKNLDVSDLKESIQFSGLQTPVGVVQNEGGFGLIYGFRRLQAMPKLGEDVVGHHQCSGRQSGCTLVGDLLRGLFGVVCVGEGQFCGDVFVFGGRFNV